MKIILNKDKVIVAKGENAYIVENGIYLDGCIYAEHGLTIEETEEDFSLHEHKFINGHVVPNEDYKPFEENVSPIDQALLNKLKSATEIFAETNSTGVSLEEYKTLRINALKEECTSAIYDGFDSESLGTSFGFNSNDQMNFTQLSLRILTANGQYKKPIQWKALDGSILTLSLEQFNILLDEAEDHKMAQQAKFWKLEAQVLAAKTAEEVLAIEW